MFYGWDIGVYKKEGRSREEGEEKKEERKKIITTENKEGKGFIEIKIDNIPSVPYQQQQQHKSTTLKEATKSINIKSEEKTNPEYNLDIQFRELDCQLDINAIYSLYSLLNAVSTHLLPKQEKNNSSSKKENAEKAIVPSKEKDGNGEYKVLNCNIQISTNHILLYERITTTNGYLQEKGLYDITVDRIGVNIEYYNNQLFQLSSSFHQFTFQFYPKLDYHPPNVPYQPVPCSFPSTFIITPSNHSLYNPKVHPIHHLLALQRGSPSASAVPAPFFTFTISPPIYSAPSTFIKEYKIRINEPLIKAITSGEGQGDHKDPKYVEVRLGLINMNYTAEEANGKIVSNRLQIQIEKWGIYIINPLNNHTFAISKQTKNPIHIVYFHTHPLSITSSHSLLTTPINQGIRKEKGESEGKEVSKIQVDLGEIEIYLMNSELHELSKLLLTAYQFAQLLNYLSESNKPALSTLDPAQLPKQENEAEKRKEKEVEVEIHMRRVKVLTYDKEGKDIMSGISNNMKIAISLYNNNDKTIQIAMQKCYALHCKKDNDHGEFKELITPRINDRNVAVSVVEQEEGEATPQFLLSVDFMKDEHKKVNVFINKFYVFLIPDIWIDFLIHWLFPLIDYQFPILAYVNKDTSTKSAEVYVDVESPEICLIENKYSESSKSMIARSNTLTKLNINYHYQNPISFYGQVKGIELFQCELNNIENSMERILNPFSIAIKLEKEILDITSSKVNIYFSTLDAMLIKNIYISSLPHLLRFLEATTKFSEKFMEESKKPEILAETATIVKTTLIEARGHLQEYCLTINENKKAYKLNINIPSIDIFIINDILASRSNSVFIFSFKQIELKLRQYNSDKTIVSLGHLFSEIKYFNMYYQAWEPLLEPTEFHFSSVQSAENINVSFQTPNDININISEKLLELVIDFADSLDKYFSSPPSYISSSALQHSTLNESNISSSVATNSHNQLNNEQIQVYLQNELGIPIVYATKRNPERKRLGASSSALLFNHYRCNYVNPPPQMDYAIYYDHHQREIYRRNQVEITQVLRVKLEDPLLEYKVIVDNILTNHCGKFKLKISDDPKINLATIEIGYKNGNKFITLRSNWLIKNECGVNITVSIQKLPARPNKPEENIENNQILPIPLIYMNGGILFFNVNDRKFSDPLTLPLKNNYYHLCSEHSCENNNSYHFLSYVEKTEQDNIIHLVSPLTLENDLPIPIKIFIKQKLDREHDFNYSLNVGENVEIHDINCAKDYSFSLYIDEKCGKTPFYQVNSLGPVHLLKFEHNSLQLSVENQLDPLTGKRNLTFYCDYRIENKSDVDVTFHYNTPNNLFFRQNSNPILFSIDKNHYNPASHKILLATNSSFAPPFTFDFKDPIDISIPHENTLYEFSVSSVFRRTTEITVNPRYLLVNKTGIPIKVKQSNSKNTISLQPNLSQPFHWTNKSNPKLISFYIDHHSWSCLLPLFDKRELVDIKLRNELNHAEFKIISLSFEKHEETGTIIISFFRFSEFPSKVIKNKTPYPLTYCQTNCAAEDKILPNETVEFGWDDYTQLPHTISIGKENGNQHILNFTNKSEKKIKLDKNRGIVVGCKLKTKGPTKILYFFEIRQKSQKIKEEEKESRQNKKKLPTGSTEISIKFSSIGVSLINAKPQEIIYFSLKDFNFSYSIDSLANQLIDLAISQCQIDNQLFHSKYPVFLIATPPSNPSPLPFFHFRSSTNLKIESIFYTENVTVTIGDLQVYLEERILTAFITLAKNLKNYTEGKFKSKNGSGSGSGSGNGNGNDEKELTSSSVPISTSKMFFFDKIDISKITICFSMNFTSSNHQSERLLPFFARILLRTDNRHFSISPLSLSNLFILKEDLVNVLIKHYKNDLWKAPLLLGPVSSRIWKIVAKTNQPKKIRYARYINNILTNYHRLDAYGVHLLNTLNARAHQRESYQGCFVLQEKHCILITSKHILFVSAAEEILWGCELADVQGLQKTERYILVATYAKVNSSWDKINIFAKVKDKHFRIYPENNTNIDPIYEILLSNRIIKSLRQ